MKKDLNTLSMMLVNGIKESIIDELKNNADNVSEKLNFFDGRTVEIHLINKTSYSLNCNGASVTEGVWLQEPPSVIEPCKTGIINTGSSGWISGTSGWALYNIYMGTYLRITWDNPYIGYNNYTEQLNDNKYTLFRKGGDGDHAVVTWTLNQKPA